MTHIERLKDNHPDWDETFIADSVENDCPTPLEGRVCPRDDGDCQKCWESEEEEDNG